jgi:hypothetical protein
VLRVWCGEVWGYCNFVLCLWSRLGLGLGLVRSFLAQAQGKKDESLLATREFEKKLKELLISIREN